MKTGRTRQGSAIDLEILKDTPPWDWPEDTSERLLRILHDATAGERELLLAAELAGDFTVIDDELADALLGVLRSRERSEEARATAAISLGPVLEHADMESFDGTGEPAISERSFDTIQSTMSELHGDSSTPNEVRRRILEASVRAPQDWHKEAIRAAVASPDPHWQLTGTFCMQYVGGFDREILQALDSKDPDVRYEAVRAAGARELDAAWPQIAAIIAARRIEKPLLLAAIDAVASIRPKEAPAVLAPLETLDDEDVAAAVQEALIESELDGQEGEEDEDDLFPDDEDEEDGEPLN